MILLLEPKYDATDLSSCIVNKYANITIKVALVLNLVLRSLDSSEVHNYKVNLSILQKGIIFRVKANCSNRCVVKG